MYEGTTFFEHMHIFPVRHLINESARVVAWYKKTKTKNKKQKKTTIVNNVTNTIILKSFIIKKNATCVQWNNLLWTHANLPLPPPDIKTTTVNNDVNKKDATKYSSTFSNVWNFCDVKLHHIFTYFGNSILLSDAIAKGIGCLSLYFLYHKWAQIFKYNLRSLLQRYLY